MTEASPLYFKQLLCGVDVAQTDASARSMANFIYLIGDRETRECVVVDPAWDVDSLLSIVAAEEMKLTGALVTHYHPDHVGGQIFGIDIMGLPQLMESHPVPIYVNKHEADGLRQVTGISVSDMKLMDSEDRIKVGSVDISFLHTPGHTPGGVSYQVNRIILSGDTIFAGSMGRANSSWPDLYRSIAETLFSFPDETALHPGHGPATTVGEEKRHNPFFCGKS